MILTESLKIHCLIHIDLLNHQKYLFIPWLVSNRQNGIFVHVYNFTDSNDEMYDINIKIHLIGKERKKFKFIKLARYECAKLKYLPFLCLLKELKHRPVQRRSLQNQQYRHTGRCPGQLMFAVVYLFRVGVHISYLRHVSERHRDRCKTNMYM